MLLQLSVSEVSTNWVFETFGPRCVRLIAELPEIPLVRSGRLATHERAQTTRKSQSIKQSRQHPASPYATLAHKACERLAAIQEVADITLVTTG
jgi:hypothetical protein